MERTYIYGSITNELWYRSVSWQLDNYVGATRSPTRIWLVISDSLHWLVGSIAHLAQPHQFATPQHLAPGGIPGLRSGPLCPERMLHSHHMRVLMDLSIHVKNTPTHTHTCVWVCWVVPYRTYPLNWIYSHQLFIVDQYVYSLTCVLSGFDDPFESIWYILCSTYLILLAVGDDNHHEWGP